MENKTENKWVVLELRINVFFEGWIKRFLGGYKHIMGKDTDFADVFQYLCKESEIDKFKKRKEKVITSKVEKYWNEKDNSFNKYILNGPNFICPTWYEKPKISLFTTIKKYSPSKYSYNDLKDIASVKSFLEYEKYCKEEISNKTKNI